MIQKLSAVIADIDGTLVEKGEMLMPLTKQALEILHAHGVLIGLASGRKINAAMHNKSNLWGLSFDFDMFSGLNGGQTEDRFHDDIVERYKLDTEVMHEIIDMGKHIDKTIMVYEKDYTLVSRVDDLIEASMKRNNSEVVIAENDDRICIEPNWNIIFRFHDEQKEEIDEMVRNCPKERFVGVHTFPGIVEFMDPRLNKGVSIDVFCERNNIPKEEVMVFGDMDNDVGLLEAGGWSVAMKNGCDATKAVADVITEYDCEHDGVGHYLFDHWIIPNGWDKE